MAKYEISHICGHNSTAQLTGSQSERERKVAWLEQQHCMACVQAERVMAAQGMAEVQAAAGLPTFVGSEKQATWATQIRHEFLNAWAKIGRQLVEVAVSDGTSARLAEQILFELDGFIGDAKSNNYAQWWIDNRERLSESGIRSHIDGIKHQIADQFSATVGSDFPVSDADQREIVKIVVGARQRDLQRKRDSAKLQHEQQHAEEIANAQAKVKAAWSHKDEIAAAILAAIGSERLPAKLSIWPSGRDVRVYLDGHRHKSCFYLTGNQRNRPESLTTDIYGINTAALATALKLTTKYFSKTSFIVTPEGQAK